MARILVVEDEADIQEVLEYNLKRDGHDVVLTGDRKGRPSSRARASPGPRAARSHAAGRLRHGALQDAPAGRRDARAFAS